MLRTFLEKLTVKRTIRKLVDLKAVESLLHDGAQRKPLTRAHIEFVLAFVSGDNPTEISEGVGRVADIAAAHGAVVHNLIGPLVTVAFGTQPVSTIQPGNRASLVNELHRQLAGHVKILHGAAEGYYGLIGSEARISYSFLLPQFNAMLGALSRLEFGKVEEFRR